MKKVIREVAKSQQCDLWYKIVQSEKQDSTSDDDLLPRGITVIRNLGKKRGMATTYCLQRVSPNRKRRQGHEPNSLQADDLVDRGDSQL